MGARLSRRDRIGRRVRQLVFEPTTRVRPEEFRNFRLLSVGTLAAIAIHATIQIIFACLGVWELVAFNVVSIGVYVVAFLANRRGWHVATVLLGLSEVVAHQVACVVILGWSAGFQFYLITISAAVFYLPTGRTYVKLSVLLVTAASYLILLTLSTRMTPLHPLDPAVLQVFGAANMVAVFAFISLFAASYSRAAEVAELRRVEEYERAERLLRNILPEPVAERLKTSPDIIAERVPAATILFADIVGFTPLAEHTSPEKLVALLNDVFSEFDELVALHGLEKIKTIGDAYMVAAGLPQPRADRPQAATDLALAMIQQLERRAVRTGLRLQMRVGLHSGPVIAGVIGKHKFAYDLWGDSVNVAARMESHGVPGEVQVTAPIAERLRSDFFVESRGMVEIKGKGSMETYLVKGRRGTPSPG